MRIEVAATRALERDPTDPRVQRTRAKLLTAFNRLFLEHGYEAITPAQIAAEAGVGRSTFYEHHSSKEALLRHSVTPLLQPLAAAATGDTSLLTDVLRHFWAKRRLASKLLADRPGRVIRDQLAELTVQALRTSGANCAVPLPMLAVGTAASQLAQIEAWLSGRHDCTAEQLSEQLTSGSPRHDNSTLRDRRRHDEDVEPDAATDPYPVIRGLFLLPPISAICSYTPQRRAAPFRVAGQTTPSSKIVVGEQ